MAAAIGALLAPTGCQSLNENPNNKHYWFPALFPPSREEKEARDNVFHGNADPYLDAEVGPRSFNTRPRGWEFQRERSASMQDMYTSEGYYDD